MNINTKLAAFAFYGMPTNGQKITIGECIWTFWQDGEFPEPIINPINLVVHDAPANIADYLAESVGINFGLTQCHGTSKNGILVLATTESGINISSDASNCIVADFDE